MSISRNSCSGSARQLYVKNARPDCEAPSEEEELVAPIDIREFASLWHYFVTEIPGPEEAFERAELCDLVRRVVDGLPSREARVIRAHYFDDEHLADLARCTTGTKSKFSRIHIKAKARLVRRITQLLLFCGAPGRLQPDCHYGNRR